MKKIVSCAKTALILLIVTVLSLSFYAYMLVRPISFAMDYHCETVYAGETFEGTIQFYYDNTMSFTNSNFDEEQIGFYYYQDGYVFLLMADTEDAYEEEVTYIIENFEEAIQSPFYALEINAFRLGKGSAEENSFVYTCTAAKTFAKVFGVIELVLIALTCSVLIFCKKKKTNLIHPISSCFSEEPVNLGRQKELDIAKGIAIIFMIFCHALEVLGWLFDPAVSTDFAYGLLDVVLGGSFAAPVFIFCMGISFSYSRKNSAGDMLRRAWKTAGIVVILEFFRTALPGFIEWLIFKDPECIEYVYTLFCVDILQFVTMAVLVIALFKKLNLKPVVMLIIATICSIAGQLLQMVSTGSRIGDIAVGFLWHSHDQAYFPLLSWLILPVCGYIFGDAWLRLKDKKSFFRFVTPVSWVISIAYFVSMAFAAEEYYLSGGYYYGLGILDVVFALIICFAMIGLGYYLNQWGGFVARWLASMGNRVTSIYCIHWTLYCFMYLVLLCVLEDYLPQWTLIPAGVFVIAVSDILSRIYTKFKKRKH